MKSDNQPNGGSALNALRAARTVRAQARAAARTQLAERTAPASRLDVAERRARIEEIRRRAAALHERLRDPGRLPHALTPTAVSSSLEC